MKIHLTFQSSEWNLETLQAPVLKPNLLPQRYCLKCFMVLFYVPSFFFLFPYQLFDYALPDNTSSVSICAKMCAKVNLTLIIYWHNDLLLLLSLSQFLCTDWRNRNIFLSMLWALALNSSHSFTVLILSL